MTPINEFLISKEMTATDLLNLCATAEDAFWDEYQDWRRGNVNEVAEKLKELAPGETLPEMVARVAGEMTRRYPLDTTEEKFARADRELRSHGYSILPGVILDGIKAATLDRTITAEVYS